MDVITEGNVASVMIESFFLVVLGVCVFTAILFYEMLNVLYTIFEPRL